MHLSFFEVNKSGKQVVLLRFKLRWVKIIGARGVIKNNPFRVLVVPTTNAEMQRVVAK